MLLAKAYYMIIPLQGNTRNQFWSIKVSLVRFIFILDTAIYFYTRQRPILHFIVDMRTWKLKEENHGYSVLKIQNLFEKQYADAI